MPRCCESLVNIRRYEPDGSGTIIAERANEFWRGGKTALGGASNAFCKVAAGYLWVMYHLAARDGDGRVITIDPEDQSFDVTVLKRYTLDLSEEATYSYTLSGLTLPSGVDPVLVSPRGYLPSRASFPEYQSFDVMPDGSPFAVIGYYTSGYVFGGQPATYKLRAWNPDGSIKWTVDNPATTIGTGRICATHMGTDGVWMVWTRAVQGAIEPGDPSPSMDTVLEVYADLRSTETGALITRLSLQALHNELGVSIWPDTAFGEINPFISTTVGGGRLAVISRAFAYDWTTDTSPGPWHFRAAIAKADATDYTWFRLRRPTTGGATSGYAGWEALGGGYASVMTSEAQLTFAIAPISTKASGQALGLWICAQTSYTATYNADNSAMWWMFTLDGNYMHEYQTYEGQPLIYQESTGYQLIMPGNYLGIYPSREHNIQQGTHAAYDDNAALLYVRKNIIREIIDSSGANRLYDRGTVLAVRNNLSEMWVTPEFNQLDPDGTNDIYPFPTDWMSIAYDSTDGEASYYLVGPSAF